MSHKVTSAVLSYQTGQIGGIFLAKLQDKHDLKKIRGVSKFTFLTRNLFFIYLFTGSYRAHFQEINALYK